MFKKELSSVEKDIEILEKRKKRLQLLHRGCIDLITILNIDKLLNVIMQYTTIALDAERSSLFLIKGSKKKFLVSRIAQKSQEIKIPLSKTSIAGYVALSGEIVNVKDAYQCAYFDSKFDLRNNFKTHSMLSVPMKNLKGEIIGVTQAINKKGRGVFSQEDEDILLAFSAQSAIAIENASYYEEQRKSFDGLVRVLSIAVDARDHLTSGHSLRVSQYAYTIGKEMGLSEEDLEVLVYAALFHDHGKIAVPDSVLQKPGDLTDEEFNLIKSHAQNTRLILAKVRNHFPKKFYSLPEIASLHHEKLDGTGYPDGLTTDQIPLGAQIIAVADIFDALTSTRHYRKPLSHKEAIKILREDVYRGKINKDAVESLFRVLPKLIKVSIRKNKRGTRKKHFDYMHDLCPPEVLYSFGLSANVQQIEN